MKRLAILLALLLVFPAAFAGNGGDNCRNINAKAVFQGLDFDCEYKGFVYDICYISKIWGSINGSWFTYAQFDWLTVLEDLGVPTPPGASDSYYNREIEVFNSKQGTVWGDAHFILDSLFDASDGGASIPTYVSGGTGIYEDAEGWINAIFTDASLENFELHGRVCGPNIE
jgi:hypothetical protein